MARVLLLFTRSPEAEARAKGLGSNAVPLFRALLDSWLRLAERTGTPVVVSAPAACRRRLESAGIASGVPFLTQEGSRFGDRLADAVARAFEGGADTVVVAGTDGPAVSADELRRAFEDAESGALALGPAADGGVYLVALGPADVPLCRAIRAGDGRALARMAAEAIVRGRSVRLLGPRDEIDGRVDAARLRHRAPVDPRWHPFLLLLTLALRPGARSAVRPRGAGSPGVRRREGSRAPPRAA